MGGSWCQWDSEDEDKLSVGALTWGCRLEGWQHRCVNFRDSYAGLLRSCLRDATDWHGVERCFREGVDEDEIEDSRPVVYAFGYMLVASRRDQIRERAGIFGAQFEIGGSIFPAPLAEIPAEMLDVWAAYAEATAEFPLAASRLNDLLWVRRQGERAVDRARRAIDAYLVVAEAGEGMDSVDCILRAIEIAAEINDKERSHASSQLAFEVSRAEIANPSERRPGIPLSLLEAIVDLRSEEWPDALGELIDGAGERYGEDPFIAQSVSELKQALSDPEEREELQRREVARWREEAKRGDGILRYSRLQQALGLARTNGFTDTAEEILLEMQSFDIADFDLKPITAEVEVPREEVDALLRSYAEESGSWEVAFRRFGSEGPPSGEADDNVRLTKELAEKYPLGRIFATQIMGPHGSVVAQAADEDEHDRVDLAKHEAMRIRIWAPLGVEILDTIKATFGVPDRAELSEFFATELIDRDVAARIGDGVARFLEGDDDGALHILVPQLEAAIRGAAARSGVVVIRTPRGVTPGGARALRGILADLNGRLDESWRRYLANALADPLGVNLRNQVSHGLHGPASRSDVAIAIQAACHLRLWRPGEGEDGPPDPDDDRPE